MLLHHFNLFWLRCIGYLPKAKLGCARRTSEIQKIRLAYGMLLITDPPRNTKPGLYCISYLTVPTVLYCM